MARPALLFGLLLLAGCSGTPLPGSDGGVDAGVIGVTPVELCERLAAARCGLMARCYLAFAQEELLDCLPLENQRCIAEYETMRESFVENLVGIDATRLGNCEARMQSSSCPPTFPPNYPAVAAHPFNDCGLQTGLIIGKIASGQTCARAVECEPGSVCVKPGGVCKGTCSKWAQEAEACGFGCSPGLACDVTPFVTGAVGKCVVPQPADTRCQFHWTCAPGLVCADLDYTGFPASSPTPGICRKPAEPNTNCPATQYQLYVGDQCGEGTVCNLELRKCLPPPRQGDDCTPSSQTCVGTGIYCKPSGSVDLGRCTGPAGSGERCAFEIDPTRKVTVPCSTGYCDTVTTLSCQPASKPDGTECKEDGECVHNRCVVQEDRVLRCAQACN